MDTQKRVGYRRPPLDQAARRGACAGDEREGKARMAGSSCWSEAFDFTDLDALGRRNP